MVASRSAGRTIASTALCAGWGGDDPPEKRNGEWEFQAFNADKSVNRSENLDRCFACHKGHAAQDFVFTYGRMKIVN